MFKHKYADLNEHWCHMPIPHFLTCGQLSGLYYTRVWCQSHNEWHLKSLGKHMHLLLLLFIAQWIQCWTWLCTSIYRVRRSVEVCFHNYWQCMSCCNPAYGQCSFNKTMFRMTWVSLTTSSSTECCNYPSIMIFLFFTTQCYHYYTSKVLIKIALILQNVNRKTIAHLLLIFIKTTLAARGHLKTYVFQCVEELKIWRINAIYMYYSFQLQYQKYSFKWEMQFPDKEFSTSYIRRIRCNRVLHVVSEFLWCLESSCHLVPLCHWNALMAL